VSKQQQRQHQSRCGNQRRCHPAAPCLLATQADSRSLDPTAAAANNHPAPAATSGPSGSSVATLMSGYLLQTAVSSSSWRSDNCTTTAAVTGTATTECAGKPVSTDVPHEDQHAQGSRHAPLLDTQQLRPAVTGGANPQPNQPAQPVSTHRHAPAAAPGAPHHPSLSSQTPC
jgi:hypothetical protein